MTKISMIPDGFGIYLQAFILSVMTTAIYSIGQRILFGKNPPTDVISLYLYIGLFGYWIILALESGIQYLKNE